MKAGDAFSLRHRGRWLQTCHLIHLEDKGLNLSLWYAVTLFLPFRFLFFLSSVCHFGSVLSATAALALKNVSDTASLKLYVQFAVLWLYWSKRWRLLENSETLRGSMDSWHLFMRPDSGLKPHTHLPGGRYYFLLLLICCSGLPSTWPIPGNYPVPLDLSPALLSYVQISWVQIIKL